jgi:hypothetical protein
MFASVLFAVVPILPMRLIRVGEFLDFVSEASFDLYDGVGAKAFAFGKVGGGFDVVDAGIKDFAVERGHKIQSPPIKVHLKSHRILNKKRERLSFA